MFAEGARPGVNPVLQSETARIADEVGEEALPRGRRSLVDDGNDASHVSGLQSPTSIKDNSSLSMYSVVEMESIASRRQSAVPVGNVASASTVYKYVVGIVNPKSGDRGAAVMVLQCLQEELGPRRVVTLTSTVFNHPETLRRIIKEHAVIYHTSTCSTLGTTSTSDAAHLPDRGADELQRGTVVVAGGDGTISFILSQLDSIRDELESELSRPASPKGVSVAQQQNVRAYTLPAVASIPLGTGNDYANTFGFGSSLGSMAMCPPWCCCLVGEKDGLTSFLRRVVPSPAVQFDRWVAQLVPLKVAQQSAAAGNATTPSVAGRSFANLVHLVDWESIAERRECISYSVINYVGIGLDAYIACKFDSTRSKHPKLCSSRLQNIAVYGMWAARSVITSRTINNLVPLVCIPSRSHSARRERDATDTETAGNKADMIALQLPAESKAVVMANVSCYCGGARPWQLQSGTQRYLPVQLSETGVSMLPDVSVSPPILTEVAVNDRKFELQAMRGILHYGSMKMGLASGIKMDQPSELFIFILCNPWDLKLPPGHFSAFTKQKLLPYLPRIEREARVRAALYVQIDGESVPHVTEPTIIHIHPNRRERVYVRCLNPAVVQAEGAPEESPVDIPVRSHRGW